MNPTLKRSLIIFVIVVLAIGLVPLIIASFYNHPSADDFNYSILTHNAAQTGSLFDVLQSAWDTSMFYMQTWQGIYSSAFLLSLQPAIFGEEWYVITCPLLLLISLAGFLAICHSLSKYFLKTSSRAWIAIALLLWFYFIEQMPSPVQGLYWYNGAMNYVPFWSLGCITIGLMIRYYFQQKQSIVCILVASIAAFIVAGGNHVTSFGTIMMIAYIAGWAIYKKQRFASLIPLIVCIIGFIIVMTAPGTQVRADELNVDRSVVWTLTHTVIDLVRFLGDWANLRLALVFIMMLPFLITACKQSKIDPKFLSWKSISCILILALVFLYAMLCVPMYSLQSHGDGRLLNVLFATFLVLSLALVTLVIGTIQAKYPSLGSWVGSSQKHMISSMVIIMSLCALFILLSPGTWLQATTGIANGSFKEYHQQMNMRQELLLDSNS